MSVNIKENTFQSVSILVLAALMFSRPAESAITPKPLAADARLGELNFDRDQIFLIQVAKGTATHILLGTDEKIVASAPGNSADCTRQSSEWCFVANVGANELFVQPRTVAPSRNNLQLSTNLRRYSFEFVQSAAVAGGPAPWYRVAFRYASDGRASHSSPALVGTKGRLCNWNYSLSRSHGASHLAPLAVFDDGSNTYLMLPPGSETPELEAETGVLQLKPAYGAAGGQLLMLPGVRGNFTLRSGLASVAVWNDDSSASPAGACPAW